VPEGYLHSCHIDLLGFAGGEKDDQVYLKYYSDDKTRQQWHRDLNVTLPERALPPFHRDESLPR
jgi:hypothetical protein